MSNHVTLVGNLVDDIDLRFTPSGVATARGRLAVNRRWRDQSGEWKEDTSFFTFVMWRDLAENAAESLKKGDRVIVTGRIEQRSWENEQGERRTSIEIQVEELGASLRFATASVARKSGSGGSSAPSAAAEPGDAPF